MKRRLLTIVICLLLGAVVNVAVAWGCAAWGGQATNDDRPVAAQRIWDRYAPEGWPPFDDYASGSSWGRSSEKVWSTSYADVPGGKIRSLRGDFRVGQVRVGLPFRTFQYGWYSHEYGSRESGSFNAWLARPEPRRLIIPYEPIWLGFAVNTIFYAALLWLLMYALSALRRFVRLRRGLCPNCAYPMGGSAVCTECGGALDSRRTPDIP